MVSPRLPESRKEVSGRVLLSPAEKPHALGQRSQVVTMLSCFSHVQLFITPRTVAHQAPLSMECSKQNYCSGLPFPTLGIFLTHGSLAWVSCIGKQILYRCTVWEARLLGYARIRPPKCATLLRESHSKSSWLFCHPLIHVT